MKTVRRGLSNVCIEGLSNKRGLRGRSAGARPTKEASSLLSEERVWRLVFKKKAKYSQSFLSPREHLRSLHLPNITWGTVIFIVRSGPFDLNCTIFKESRWFRVSRIGQWILCYLIEILELLRDGNAHFSGKPKFQRPIIHKAVLAKCNHMRALNWPWIAKVCAAVSQNSSIENFVSYKLFQLG